MSGEPMTSEHTVAPDSQGAPDLPGAPAPFERTFRPSRRDLVQRFLVGVPNWVTYLVAIYAVVNVSNVAFMARSGRFDRKYGLSMLVTGAVALLLLVVEIIHRLSSSTQTCVQLDEAGVRVTRGPLATSLAWKRLSVRVTASAYVFFTPMAYVLPLRVLSAAERGLVEDWLAARHVRVKRKPMPSITKVLMWIFVLMAFVTFYNLFQPNSRPHH